MIITLLGANFENSHIGTLSTWRVYLTDSIGTSISPNAIEKNAEGTQAANDYTGTITVNSNYKFTKIKYVQVGQVRLTSDAYTISNQSDSGATIVIPANKISGNVTISVATEAVSVEPDTPSMYTFTINPTPPTATVTLTASGYSQSGNTITVPANTVVTWKVSASGYTEQTGTYTVTKDEIKNVSLSGINSEGWEDITSLFHFTEDKMIYADNGDESTHSGWIASDYVDISQYSMIEIKMSKTSSITTNTGLALYDKDKNYLRGIAHTDGVATYGTMVKQINVVDASYIRTTYWDTDHASYQSSYGDFYCKATDMELYTITYKYMCDGNEIQTSTLESVEPGTYKEFTINDAPQIIGYDVVSVTPLSVTINESIEVIFNYRLLEITPDADGWYDITSLFVFTPHHMIDGNSGKETAITSWDANLNYVDISEYKTIEIKMSRTSSTGSTTGIALYDKDKNYVRGVYHVDEADPTYGVMVKTIDVSDVNYIRTTYWNKQNANYNTSWGDFYCKAKK